MKVVLKVAIASCLLQAATALQMILATREPTCVLVVPKQITNQKIDISYTVTGVNEKDILFTVSD